MNHQSELQGDWEQQKIKLKLKFPFLEKADLQFEKGKKAAMLENLQIKLGKPRPELYRIIEEL